MIEESLLYKYYKMYVTFFFFPERLLKYFYLEIWVIFGFTQRRIVVSYRRFESTHRSYLQVSSSRRNFINILQYSKIQNCHIYGVLTLLKLFTTKLFS